ncbi:MAG: hemolysin III family protein [Treponemataceae bacterium]|nr:hemolysin III family protein [Treponemataceae bacterium]
MERKTAAVRPAAKQYSSGEEIFNAVTHGVGAALSAAALVLLVVRAVTRAPAEQRGYYVVSFALFGASLVVLYLMSTLYHALTPQLAKKVFAVFDHSSIYFLIAGTYTPFCLTALRGAAGWTLFGIVWTLALAGISLYAVFGSRMRSVSAVTYVVMGLLVLFAIRPMRAALPPVSLALLIAGGVAYLVGFVFYALKKIKWMHSVWHLFVLAGSVLHFFSVYLSIS